MRGCAGSAWARPGAGLAGSSAFGMSGVNAHALIRRAPASANEQHLGIGRAPRPDWRAARHYPLPRAHALLCAAAAARSGAFGSLCCFSFLPGAAAAAHLRQNRLAGDPLLPAGALLEMAAAAAHALGEAALGAGSSAHAPHAASAAAPGVADATFPAAVSLQPVGRGAKPVVCVVAAGGAVSIMHVAAPAPPAVTSPEELAGAAAGGLQGRLCALLHAGQPGLRAGTAETARPRWVPLPPAAGACAGQAGGRGGACAGVSPPPADVRTDAYLCHPGALAALLGLRTAPGTAGAAGGGARRLAALELYFCAGQPPAGARSGLLSRSAWDGLCAVWDGVGGLLAPGPARMLHMCSLAGPGFSHAREVPAAVPAGSGDAAAELVYDVEWQAAAVAGPGASVISAAGGGLRAMVDACRELALPGRASAQQAHRRRPCRLNFHAHHAVPACMQDIARCMYQKNRTAVQVGLDALVCRRPDPASLAARRGAQAQQGRRRSGRAPRPPGRLPRCDRGGRHARRRAACTPRPSRTPRGRGRRRARPPGRAGAAVGRRPRCRRSARARAGCGRGSGDCGCGARHACLLTVRTAGAAVRAGRRRQPGVARPARRPGSSPRRGAAGAAARRMAVR